VGETVELQALETAGVQYREKEATTDDAGSFLFENLLPGLYHVRWVEKQGETGCYRITKRIEIPEEGDAPHVRLQREGKTTLFGSLAYDGTLPEVVNITIRPRIDSAEDGHSEWAALVHGVLAHHGRFEVEGLVAGEYTVSAYFVPGGGTRYVRGRSGWAQGSTKVVLPAEGSIEVSVEMSVRER
jgi:hypothetical protein